MALETETVTEAVSTTRRKMSFEEFLEWADEDTHAEWVDGEVVEMSPISEDHQRLDRFLINLFTTYTEEKQLGEIFFEPYLMKTGADLPGREPDILFVANEHRDRLKGTYLEGPADLTVEIISPESGRRDRGEKFDEYETGGVSEYWLIDPIREQAMFYQRGEDGLYRSSNLDEEGRYYSATLVGLWVKPEWFWMKPLPSTLSIFREWKLI
jgi:Uma2 family endonuclease